LTTDSSREEITEAFKAFPHSCAAFHPAAELFSHSNRGSFNQPEKPIIVCKLWAVCWKMAANLSIYIVQGKSGEEQFNFPAPQYCNFA